MATYKMFIDNSKSKYSVSKNDEIFVEEADSLEGLFMVLVSVLEDGEYDDYLWEHDEETDMDKMNYVCGVVGIDKNLATIDKIKEYLDQIDTNESSWVKYIKNTDTGELIYEAK